MVHKKVIIRIHFITYTKLDIVLIDKSKKQTYIIDITVPNTHSIENTVQEEILNTLT